jgi:3D (Asp-Asp-Asp) domain-containing protein
MAATPSGHGYWLVAADGGIFSFGDAHYLGSTGGVALNQPIVGMAATPSGHGYWLVAADGGIFTFGDAHYLGSAAGRQNGAPIVGITRTHDGAGYWLAASDGAVYTYGSAPFAGAVGTNPNQAPAVAVAATPSSRGYWVATGRPQRVRLGTFVATCYTGGGHTASGTTTSTHEIAVDPSVIPLGTHLWIDGFGPRVAEDTGGAIKGNRIDIWEPTYSACVQFGRQAVQVYLDEGTW